MVLGVFLFNPEKGVRLGETVAAMEVEDPNAISVEDYMLSMVDYTEEWQPLESYELDLVSVTEEEVIAVEMPMVNEEVTTEDLTDFIEDEDYYEYEF